MRILSRADFLRCPAGTVFFDQRENSTPENLSVKASGPSDAPSDDFCRIDVDSMLNYAKAGSTESCSSSEEAFDLLEAANKGERIEMHFDAGGRDGMFDQEQKFAVLDHDDILRLVALLTGGALHWAR